MASPIQQLVDAAKEVLEFATPRRLNWPTAPPARLHAAIRAVESAQVETQWQVEYISDGIWSDATVPAYSLEGAQQQLREVKWDRELRIVRLDTYRSVESDQK